MYNSFIVRIFVGAGNAFSLAYNGSILRRIVGIINSSISYLAKDSIAVGIFTKNFSLIEDSYFYGLFSKILKFFSKTFVRLNNLFNRIGEESIACSSIRKLFSTELALIRTLSTFVFFFAVGIILINLDSGLYWGRTYIVSIILILGSLTVFNRGENFKISLENSSVYGFIKNLFIIDEGGDQWW